MFENGFGKFALEGEKIECVVDGFKCIAHLERDDDGSPPWKREDGHGPVSDWTDRAKEPGERILNQDRDGSKRYYDFAEAVKIARRDGWGCSKALPTDTKRQVIAKAVESDFEFLKAWCDDEWHYVGVCITVFRDGIRLTDKYAHALWGIECNCPGDDNSYLKDVANENLDEALEDARATLKKLCAGVCAA